MNVVIHALLFILYLIRFIKFIKVKKFLFENKNLYVDEYLPKRFFNIDSFPIALEINIFLYYILYMIFPKKPSACCTHRDRHNYEKYLCQQECRHDFNKGAIFNVIFIH